MNNYRIKIFVLVLLAVFLFGILLGGCSRVKIEGNFGGIIPCADCEGIQADLTLNPDYTYTFSFTYLGRDVEPYVTTGNWEIDKEGRLVLLAADGKSVEQYFKIVSQNAVEMLDADGNEITGTNLNFTLTRK